MATKSTNKRSAHNEDPRPLESFFKTLENEARGSSIASVAEVAEVVHRDRNAT